MNNSNQSVSATPIRASSSVLLPHSVKCLQALVNEHFEKAIKVFFEHIDDALFELTDRAESNLAQNIYFESMREIRIHRRALEMSFLQGIDCSFSNLLHKNSQVAHKKNIKDGAIDALSIISKDELEEQIAIEGIVNKISSYNREALDRMIARLDLLVNCTVTNKNCPLEPNLLVTHFTEASAKILMDIKVRLVLYKLFERHVGQSLNPLLDSAHQLLSEQGVPMPSSAKTKQQHAREGQEKNNQQLVDQHQPSSQQRDDAYRPYTHAGTTGLYGTLQTLIGIDNNTATPTATEDGAAASGSHVSQPHYNTSNTSTTTPVIHTQELITALSQLQFRQLEKTKQSNINQGESLRHQGTKLTLASEIKNVSIDDHSSDIIELVDLLFSFILDDANLPEPIKLLLSQLQIPYIKIALSDATLFKKKDHPARKLLNAMARASIGWSDNKKNDDPLIKKITSTVNKILEDFDSDSDIFINLLDDFSVFITKQDHRAKLLEKRAIDAATAKVKTEKARSDINDIITSLISSPNFPYQFKPFFENPWSNVLFFTYMRYGKGSSEWQKEIKTTKMLAWSLKPITKETKDKWRKVIREVKSLIVPSLDNIALNPIEKTAFFNELSTYYQSLLAHYADKKNSAEDHNQDNTVTNSSPNVVDVAQAQELVEHQQAISESSVHSADIEITINPQYMNLVSNITTGTWFEMKEHSDSVFRCRLAAIIKSAQKYIFVNRSGAKVAEENLESFALKVQKGRLKVLDDRMLFDRALESVITQVQKNATH